MQSIPKANAERLAAERLLVAAELEADLGTKPTSVQRAMIVEAAALIAGIRDQRARGRAVPIEEPRLLARLLGLLYGRDHRNRRPPARPAPLSEIGRGRVPAPAPSPETT